MALSQHLRGVFASHPAPLLVRQAFRAEGAERWQFEYCGQRFVVSEGETVGQVAGLVPMYGALDQRGPAWTNMAPLPVPIEGWSLCGGGDDLLSFAPSMAN